MAIGYVKVGMRCLVGSGDCCCHNFKNGKEASEVTEGIYSRMHWER